MAIYAAALRQTFWAVGGLCDLKAAQSSGLALLEFTFSKNFASTDEHGLGRSAAELVQLNPAYLRSEELPDEASKSSTAVAWATAPAVPTQFFRLFRGGATTNNIVIFTWPRGFIVSALGSILLYTNSINSAPSANKFADIGWEINE